MFPESEDVGSSGQDSSHCEHNAEHSIASASSLDPSVDAEANANVSNDMSLKMAVPGDEDLKSDIGFFIQTTTTVNEIIKTVQVMSDGQKYRLLKKHEKPSSSYLFPTQFLGGCNRAFKPKWFGEYGWWLVYSPKLNGAFCVTVCCALFTKPSERRQMGMLVNAPFTKWHHKSEVLTKHTGKLAHKGAVQDAELFIPSVENPKITIPVMTDSLREANIKDNRHILKSVAEAVLYCGRQCIALRGDNENLNKGKATKKEPEAQCTESGNETYFTPKMQPSGNPGNFYNFDEACSKP